MLLPGAFAPIRWHLHERDARLAAFMVSRGVSVGKLNPVQYLWAVAVLLVVVFHCLIRFEDAMSDGVTRFVRTGFGCSKYPSPTRCR